MNRPIQKSLFEEGFLRRSIGAIATEPESALSELVANAWDSGAVTVEITIPLEIGGIISVKDDGVGLTEDQFKTRWMTLGYRRGDHQGEWADFPSERSDWKRRAYGRNGQGRHGLLCFSPRYTVETRQFDSMESHRFIVEPQSGETPFVLVSEDVGSLLDHGTIVSAVVEDRLPNADSIIDSLSFAFLHDPQFTIVVNGKPIRIEDFPVKHREVLTIGDARATVTFREIPQARRRKASHGVAFWIGNRLVGQPDYNLQGISLIDGRSTIASRHLIVVQSEDFFDDVRADWSGFKRSPRIEQFGAEVGHHVTSVVAKLNADDLEETKQQAIQGNREEIRKLKPLARIEVTEFVEYLVQENPTLGVETVTAAVRAAVNLEKTRSGQELLDKLATISEGDASLLNGLLDDWTLRDALAVLNEIDRRLSVVTALERLTGDPDADELHTIHPLVTQARWLFGPEFDTSLYASNVTIESAASKVFRKKIDAAAIGNRRQRPDLIFLRDSTISLTGVDGTSFESEVAQLERLLLIELKRGDARILLAHRQQTEQYVQDLLSCGLLDGRPFIQAFVVGHQVDSRVSSIVVGDIPGSPEARITPCSFGQLVRSAQQRLFRLNSAIEGRYRDVPALKLIRKALGEDGQKNLFDDNVSGDASNRPIKKRRSRRAK